MVRSRRPVPSLPCLFGALLLLSPELVMRNPGTLSDVPLADPELQKVLAFAVQQYNQDRKDSANYFKVLNVLAAKLDTERLPVYHLTLVLVRTRCKKAGRRWKYKKIQRCKPLPGNQKILKCYFSVKVLPPPYGFKLALTVCWH